MTPERTAVRSAGLALPSLRVLTLAVLALALAAGCGTTPDRVAQSGLEERGLMRAFFVRQRVAAHTGDETRRFEIALESRCDELRLVGLTSFGVRLFSAVKRGNQIEVQSLAGQALPFPPEHVLRDIERTFFRSTPPDASGRVERDITHASEVIRETWESGQLVSRKIRPATDPGAQPIVIRYHGVTSVDGVPERLELSNPGFGYALSIENFGAKEIRCAITDS